MLGAQIGAAGLWSAAAALMPAKGRQNLGFLSGMGTDSWTSLPTHHPYPAHLSYREVIGGDVPLGEIGDYRVLCPSREVMRALYELSTVLPAAHGSISSI